MLRFEYGKRGKVGKRKRRKGEEGGEEWGLVWWLGGGERNEWRGVYIGVRWGLGLGFGGIFWWRYEVGLGLVGFS